MISANANPHRIQRETSNNLKTAAPVEAEGIVCQAVTGRDIVHGRARERRRCRRYLCAQNILYIVSCVVFGPHGLTCGPRRPVPTTACWYEFSTLPACWQCIWHSRQSALKSAPASPNSQKRALTSLNTGRQRGCTAAHWRGCSPAGTCCSFHRNRRRRCRTTWR